MANISPEEASFSKSERLTELGNTVWGWLSSSKNCVSTGRLPANTVQPRLYKPSGKHPISLDNQEVWVTEGRLAIILYYFSTCLGHETSLH